MGVIHNRLQAQALAVARRLQGSASLESPRAAHSCSPKQSRFQVPANATSSHQRGEKIAALSAPICSSFQTKAAPLSRCLQMGNQSPSLFRASGLIAGSWQGKRRHFWGAKQSQGDGCIEGMAPGKICANGKRQKSLCKKLIPLPAKPVKSLSVRDLGSVLALDSQKQLHPQLLSPGRVADHHESCRLRRRDAKCQNISNH